MTSYYKKLKFLQKKFSGNYVQVVPFKYGGAKTFKMAWHRWIVRQKNEGIVITIGQMAYKVKPQLSVDCAVIGLKKTGVRWAEKKLASAFPCAVMDKRGNLIVCADVGNGFTDVQRAKLTKLVLKTQVRSDDKYIYCKPKVVIEVAGQEKTKSRIPSVPVFDKNLKQIKKIQGWSVRMPRVSRFRDDKRPVYKDIRAEQLYSGGVGGWQESSLF